MTDIPILGATPAGDPMPLDVDRLIGSHACIVANSGGGKSGLIRRLLEVTHGRVQHIVLDVEDEFYTLREHFDYVIAGGDGADAPATVENAAALARMTLEQGFSLIVQLNDLGPDGAPQFVGRFLEALIAAPRALWRPLLVILDEAQRFAPQEGATEATHGVRALAAQGRKRGFTAILASQRIAKIDADVRGDINNWMLGRVGQSLDRRTMADALGFPPSGAEARGLQGLPDRTFWGFGPALSREPTLFRVSDVETTPVRPGQAKVPTPPPPEALRMILQGLVVAEVSAQPEAKNGPICQPTWPDQREEVRSLTTRLKGAEASLATARHERDHYQRALLAAKEAVDVGLHQIPAPRGGAPAPPPRREPATPPKAAPRSEGGVAPSPAALAMAELLDRINPARVTWTQAATMTGRKASGGNFNAARKWLRESGRIVEDGEFIRSSADAPAGMTRAEAIDLWKSVLSNPAPRMIEALEASALHPEELAERLGVQPRGGNWNNGLAQLRRNGVAELAGGEWRLCRPLPGESE